MASFSPKISVVVIAHNAAEYIDESIQSILQQTQDDFELIVVDDYSFDETYEKARKFQSLDERVLAFRNVKNMGVGYSRARGVSLAKGKYVAWQDADDVSISDRLQKQSDYLDLNLDVGVVGGSVEFFIGTNSINTRKYFKNDADARRFIFRQSPIAMPASMFRKEVFETVGNFDVNLRLCEDQEIFFRTGERYKFANLDDVVVKYRQSNTSVTANSLRRMERKTLLIRLKYARSRNYQIGIIDIVYNLAQISTIWMPIGLRKRLFEFIRKS